MEHLPAVLAVPLNTVRSRSRDHSMCTHHIDKVRLMPYFREMDINTSGIHLPITYPESNDQE